MNSRTGTARPAEPDCLQIKHPENTDTGACGRVGPAAPEQPGAETTKSHKADNCSRCRRFSPSSPRAPEVHVGNGTPAMSARVPGSGAGPRARQHALARADEMASLVFSQRFVHVGLVVEEGHQRPAPCHARKGAFLCQVLAFFAGVALSDRAAGLGKRAANGIHVVRGHLRL